MPIEDGPIHLMCLLKWNFTDFMNELEIEEFKNKVYTATKTGFIQLFPGCTIQNERGEDEIFNGHYVSITKSLFSKDYFLSDDLNPMEPLNMGPNAIFDKSVPVVWLFYSIIENLESNGPSDVNEWIKKNSKNIEEETLVEKQEICKTVHQKMVT